VECLLQGNLTAPEAQELVHGFLRPLGISEALDAVPPVGSTALPPGWTLLERRGANPEEKNGALVLRLQVAEHSIRSACLTALTSQILSQRFFDELRTKQQLGYIVSMSSYSEKHAFVGLRFIVQSERPPVEVLQRVRDWIEGAWGYLEADLSDEEFREYRASLVAQVRERFKSLGEEFGAHWAEVAARSLHFDLRREQAACLESLRLEDIRRFASEVLRSAPALCVLVASQRGDPELGAPRALASSVKRRPPADGPPRPAAHPWRRP
jgi:secreted Zn-dependent insulinase-like peptidase